jgi:hypothetical protein
MGDELRAAGAYGAKNDGAIAGARYVARISAMRANAAAADLDLVLLDAQLRALLGDNVTQGLPLVPAGQFKDYEIFARMIARAVTRHPLGVLLREFGALCYFWRDRGLTYPWLRRIGSVIFGIPEDVMDHALLTHLAYSEANHTGFAPSAEGTPTASAPGDTGAEGTDPSPSKTDHKHAREAYGTAAGTVCQGNDARLSDARTPTSHTNALHSTPGTPTASAPGDSGAAGSSTADAKADHSHAREAYGTAVGTVCQGNDARLSNARTPTFHTQDVTTINRFGSGFEFPGSPEIGDRFYREDRNLLYFWDGSYWLSDEIFVKTLSGKRTMPFSASDDIAGAPRQPSGTNAMIIAWDWTCYFDSTQTGTNYWTFYLKGFNGGSTIDSFNSQGMAKDTWQGARRVLMQLLGTTDIAIIMSGIKTNSGGGIIAYAAIHFRLVG